MLFESALLYAAVDEVKQVRPSFDEVDLEVIDRFISSEIKGVTYLLQRINACQTNHERLGLPQAASREEITKAFKSLATQVNTPPLGLARALRHDTASSG